MLSLVLLLAGLTFVSADYAGSYFDEGYEFAFYHSNGDEIDFVGAMVKCQTAQTPGWLSEPKTPELNDATDIARYWDYEVWIGATDLSAENRWLWLDNTEMYWTNWDQGEPNNKHDEDCLILLDSGEWNDEDCCNRADGYVCQIPIDELAYKFGHSEFDIVQFPSTFWQAQERCAAKGARLVVLEDDASEADLRRIVKFGKQKVWLARSGADSSTCYAINDNGLEETDCSKIEPASLCEKVSPHAVKVSQRRVSVPSESRVEVECTAEGYPTPDVAWYKDGQEIPTQFKSPGKSNMILATANADDAGMYTCYATNDVNKDRYEIRAITDLEVTMEV